MRGVKPLKGTMRPDIDRQVRRADARTTAAS
jgi:hypothetical protein